MVRQSGSDQGDDQQRWKFCDAYLQSSAAVASVARRPYGRQAVACSCDGPSKSRGHAECICTEIASERAAGITTVNSFSGNANAAAAYAWHDSAEPKNDEGTQWRN